MLDINFVKENKDLVKKGITSKGYKSELVDEVIEFYDNWTEKLQAWENLRRRRNELAALKKPSEEGRQIKEDLVKLDFEVQEAAKKYFELIQRLPNLPQDDVPEGKSEADNKIIREWGEKPTLSKPKDHVELGEILDIIDFENAAKVSGSGFYYLKNEAALLEVALVNYGLTFLADKGFVPIITPDLAKEEFYLGTGYLPKGEEAQTYLIEGTSLGLIATAEVTLAGLHSGQILEAKDLPKKYVGYSHCFRQEAGAYGKYSKGLYRVHQFTKVEMFAYTKLEDSKKTHEELLKLEEEFFQSLGIPYRVLEMCTGDLGAQAAKKYDLEAWMPGRGDFGEVTSTSNTTDYQSRNLNIRYKNDEGKNIFLHTLNGTLVATSRALIAILENFQQEDGSILIPEVLQKYTGFSKIKVKN